MTSRRSFLSSILSLGVAPAIVRADSLMRVIPLDTYLLTESNLEDIIIEISKIRDDMGLKLEVPLTKLLWPGVNVWAGTDYKNITAAQLNRFYK